MSEPVVATALTGEDECRRFLDDLGNCGPVGEILIEHLQGLSFLFENPGCYDVVGEIASMRKMFICACEARVALPSALPKVSAVVNLSNKRFTLLSNEWNLAVALALAPSGTQPRVGRNINGVVKAAQRDGNQLLVIVYAPFQGGASALGWELRTLRRHPSPMSPCGFVYRDDGLCVSNVDTEPRLAGSSLESMCAGGAQRETMIRCMLDNFPVVDLDAALGSAQLPPGEEGTQLGNAGMALLRRLQAERKQMLLELHELRASVQSQREAKDAEVEQQVKQVEGDREVCQAQLATIKARMVQLEDERLLSIRAAEASVAAAELQKDEEHAKRVDAERALRQAVAQNAQRDASLALERGKLHVESKRAQQNDTTLRSEIATLREAAKHLEGRCTSLSASRMADISSATARIEGLQTALDASQADLASSRSAHANAVDGCGNVLRRTRASIVIKSAVLSRAHARRRRRAAAAPTPVPEHAPALPALYHGARPPTNIRRHPNGTVYDRNLEEDVSSLHGILARLLAHARVGALSGTDEEQETPG